MDLIQDLDAVVWEANPKTLRFSFVSKRAEDIFGFPLDRWLNEPGFFAGRIHPSDRKRVVNDYRAAVREGDDHSFEYRVLAADGRIVWVRDRVRVSRDATGRPTSLRGVMVDATARKEAEEALRESEDRYRRLVEESPDAILVHVDGKFVFANESAARLLGAASPEKLIGLEAMQIVHPDFHDAVRARIEAEEQGRSVPLLEEKFVRLDGNVLDVEVAGLPATYKGKAGGQIVVRDITKRKDAEEQLHGTQAKYRALVESIPAILYIDIPSRGSQTTIYVSPQIETMLGLKQDAYKNDPWFWHHQIHPEDKDRALATYHRGVESGRPFSLEYRIVTPDERIVWIRDEAVVLEDEEGSAMVQGAMFDISEYRLAEQALKRRDAILEAVDFAAERFLGTPAWEETIDEVLRRIGEATTASRVYIFENFTAEDGSLRHRQIHEWAAEGIAPQIDNPELKDIGWIEDGWDDEMRILSSGGIVNGPVSERPESERVLLEKQQVRSLLSVPVFVEGEWWGFAGFDDCLTERTWSTAEVEALKTAAGTLGAAVQRRRTETVLRETEAKYRAIVEQIPAVLYVDEPSDEWMTSYISPQLQTMLGISPADWVADPELWYKHLHPDDRDRAYETYRAGVAEGEPFSFEYRMITPKGMFWIRDEAIVLKDGAKTLVQGVMFDITERKKAEEALLESEGREREAARELRSLNEMKNTFLAAVSHEMRSPLTSVLGLSLTLEQQPDLPSEERADLIERLSSNARKLQDLLTNLLDLDRLSRGVITPQRRPTDIGALARRALENVDHLDGRKVTVQADDIVAYLDGPKVERIVENLLVNAARHTAPDTAVWLNARAENGGVLITVEDDGPGIPPEISEEIFEPFRQGPNPSPHNPGTGIGLALVRRFAELHGGRAWVEPGKKGGAAFHVYLPDDSPEEHRPAG
ncbi:MAG: PAS domain S-box protein [Actinomycetota bacterium]